MPRRNNLIERKTLQRVPKLQLSKSTSSIEAPLIATHKASGRSQMSDARRQRLLNLQKRERLKALLVRKFRMKYGTGKQVSKLIAAAVEQFVQLRKVTERDLKELERKVRAACRTIGAMPRNSNINADDLLKTVGAQQTKSQQQALSPGETIVSELQGSASHGTEQQLATVKHSQSESALLSENNPQSTAGSGALASTGETMPEDWTLINRYQAKINEDEKLMERAAMLEKRRKIQEELESQIKIKEKQKKVASTGDEKYVKYLEEQKKKWAEEDRIKNAKRKALIDKDRAMLQKQVQDRRNRIKAEKEEQRKYEVNLIKRMKKELETVRKKELEAKINDKKRLVAFLAGNALVREQKEARKKKLAEEDVQRMKEYAKMLEEQEKARESYFADMTKRQEKFLDLNVEARQEEFENIKRMERINLEYQLKREQEEKEAARLKIIERRKKDQEIANWIKNEMKKKEEIRAKEKERYAEINAVAKKMTADAQAEEEKRKRAIAEKRNKYKKELQSQIQARSHLYEKVGRQIRRKQTNMDDREREFNKSLIEKIKHEVPQLLSPVVSPVKKDAEVGNSIY
eukprot:g74.t1